ncbi:MULTISPECIES: phosphotransferase enzyme family protein [unclassified Paenibacillus]|uniref:phosphotransferase enzyme family protein n=1 Tax=unclassified Paenibacillus TaxID=185978 RepID=UPI000465A1C7|nr:MULTISPECIES: phosphotransferase [unclassified Paenibacillus]
MWIITTHKISHDIMAIEIISHYSIEKPSVSFIRHNENLTYQVVDDVTGQKYLLRIHKAAFASMTGIQHTRPALEAEMNLLHELRATSPLRVQTPVRNTSGEWVTVWLDEAGEEICSTVLEWIEGRDIKQGERLTTAQIHDLGVQLQTLHQSGRRPKETPKPQVGSQKSERRQQVNDREQHADKAIIPEIYTDSPALDQTGVRPAYGSIKENLVMLEQLEEGVRRGIFTPEDFDLIRETFENINRQLETYPHTAETWGVIHADITRGNLLVTDQGISMIDFCLYGYGYYLFDAGGAATIFNREERDIFLSGYTEQAEPLTKRDIRLMEGFMLIFTFGYFAFQMENESRYEWMKERMPLICSKFCRPYVHNESIFYEL